MASSARIGLTPDELLAATWCAERRPSYVAAAGDVRLLAGETLALVGPGRQVQLERFADAIPGALLIDGRTAGSGGTLRIHAQQAARVGISTLVISDPFDGLAPAARALAVADVAGLGSLGVTTVLAVGDVPLAALVADRVVAVGEDARAVSYPVLAPRPRREADVAAVTARLAQRLAVA